MLTATYKSHIIPVKMPITLPLVSGQDGIKQLPEIRIVGCFTEVQIMAVMEVMKIFIWNQRITQLLRQLSPLNSCPKIDRFTPTSFTNDDMACIKITVLICGKLLKLISNKQMLMIALFDRLENQANWDSGWWTSTKMQHGESTVQLALLLAFIDSEAENN